MQNEEKLFHMLKQSGMSLLEIEDALKCIDYEISYTLIKIDEPDTPMEAEVL